MFGFLTTRSSSLIRLGNAGPRERQEKKISALSPNLVALMQSRTHAELGVRRYTAPADV